MKNNKIENIPTLIELITPLNNEYRDLINTSAKGVRVLEVMWDVGNYLDSYIAFTNIKPHKLYWQIYGKAEGIKRSYITRDFLSYCLRIKKYFSTKKDIKKDYPNLSKYSLFREAFPLLENAKFQLPKYEQKKLIVLLNSKTDPNQIKRAILKIKKERIGISNTRKQKLSEMAPYTAGFVRFYNDVYKIIKTNDIKETQKLRSLVSQGYLNDLSQLISALTQEGLFVPSIEANNKLPKYWQDFITNSKKLFLGNIEMRNRFRRLVAPKKIMQLSDMVIALVDDKNLTNFKKRNNLA